MKTDATLSARINEIMAAKHASPSLKLCLIAMALADKQLTPPQIAAATNISLRQIQRLWPAIKTAAAMEKPRPTRQRPDKQTQLAAIRQNLPAYQSQFPSLDIEAQYALWTDWMAAKGRRFTDYAAAFRNWCRKARPTTTPISFMTYFKNGGRQ